MRLRQTGLAGIAVLCVAATLGSAACSDARANTKVGYAINTGRIFVIGDDSENSLRIYESPISRSAATAPDVSFKSLGRQQIMLGAAYKYAVEEVKESGPFLSQGELPTVLKFAEAVAPWVVFIVEIVVPTNRQFDMDRVLNVWDGNGGEVTPLAPCYKGRYPGTSLEARSLVQCPLLAGDLPDLDVFARGGDDTVNLNLVAGWLSKRTVDGGRGRDTLNGSNSGDTLIGGREPDVMRGYGGVDWLMSDGDGVVDEVDCGSPGAPSSASDSYQGDMADPDFSEADTIVDCEDIAWPELPLRFR